MRRFAAVFIAAFLAMAAHAQAFDSSSPEDQSDDSLNLRHEVIFSGEEVPAASLIAKATYQLVYMLKDPLLKNYNVPACSATLIDKDILLTAGHCIPDLSVVNIFAKYYSGSGAQKSSLVKVAQAFVHGEYRHDKNDAGSDIMRADIALLRLESNLPGGIPASLPQAKLKLTANQNVTIAGYGMNGHIVTQQELLANPEIIALAKTLKANPKMNKDDQTKVILQMMSVAEVKPLLSAEAKGELIPQRDGSLAALKTLGNQHVCSGDSGGPTYLRGDSRLVVIGVHSTTTDSGCDGQHGGVFGFFDQSKFPSLDTYVPNYLNWIKKTILILHSGREI